MEIIKVEPESRKPITSLQLACRDDKIRTCDPTPPRRVRYRAALHPEFGKNKAIYYMLPRSQIIYCGINFAIISKALNSI